MPSAQNSPSGHVPLQRLAAAAGIAPRAVRTDIADGAPSDTVEGYLSWRLRNRRPMSQDLNVGAETARLRRAQAEREEQEVARRRRDLLPAEAVRQVALAASGVFASQLEALPGRLANELAACNDPALVLATLRAECQRIRAATAAALNELAAASDGEDGDAAAAPDAGPVGGPNAPTPSGLSGAGPIPE